MHPLKKGGKKGAFPKEEESSLHIVNCVKTTITHLSLEKLTCESVLPPPPPTTHPHRARTEIGLAGRCGSQREKSPGLGKTYADCQRILQTVGVASGGLGCSICTPPPHTHTHSHPSKPALNVRSVANNRELIFEVH